MPLPPQPRQRTPHAAGNHILDKGDQIVTKVDKTCHRQPPPYSQTPAKHSKTRKSSHPVNPIANPRCQPLRRIPNNPEQIRTDPNTVVARLGPLTPHLTSPLEGGRDELGEEE